MKTKKIIFIEIKYKYILLEIIKISTTNVTLNNQMDVDSIATRMKSNKRGINKNNEQACKKSRKTRQSSEYHMNCESVYIYFFTRKKYFEKEIIEVLIFMCACYCT